MASKVIDVKGKIVVIEIDGDIKDVENQMSINEKIFIENGADAVFVCNKAISIEVLDDEALKVLGLQRIKK